MAQNSWQDRLNAAKAKFAAAENEAKSSTQGGPLIVSPPGNYITLLKKCQFVEPKDSSKSPFIVAEHEVTEAEDNARIGEINKVLFMLEGKTEEDNERLIKNAVRFTVTCGYEIDLDNIADSLKEICEDINLQQYSCRIGIKYVKEGDTEYRNLYLNKILDAEDAPEPVKKPIQVPARTSVTASNTVAQPAEAKKRGRPAGSTNAPKPAASVEKPAPEENEDEEGIEPQIGMRGDFTFKGEEMGVGEIVEILEAEGMLRVKSISDDRIRKIKGENFSPILDEDNNSDEEEE